MIQKGPNINIYSKVEEQKHKRTMFNCIGREARRITKLFKNSNAKLHLEPTAQQKRTCITRNKIQIHTIIVVLTS
jgi:hypothetical protein